MPERLRLLEQWLRQSCRLDYETIAPASADASFRRYFRVTKADDTSLVVMDAPPDKEDCRPFVAVARVLAEAGVHAPTIIEQDLEQGFLLLEDFGAVSFLDRLTADNADDLYADALEALLQMQAGAATDGLPPYDEALLRREMALFPDWLLARHLGLTLSAQEKAMLAAVSDVLVANALSQPKVFVHRDYHSRNLMVVAQRNPGVIDFQDAVLGPVTYDLVSLLRDCYVQWPAEQVDCWVLVYAQRLRDVGLLTDTDDEQFLRWFDLMGVQRHLKAAGIFARLNHRDGKSGYLADIPRTLSYIEFVGGRRREIAALQEFLEMRVRSLLAQPCHLNVTEMRFKSEGGSV